MDKLVFVDLETTGCNPIHDRIIEIGILRVENNVIVETYNKLINPECYISPFITQITNINSEDIEYAPTFYAVKDEVMALLSDCIFVAHNARFDYGFLRQEFKRFDMSFSSKQLCTAKLSRKLFPEHKRHNLDSIIERFGFDCENRHRAYDDAKVMVDFYQTLQKQIEPEILEQAINQIIKKPSIPQNLSHELIHDLPESPGVYMFYGENDMPLYVGKSINIRDRVMSHFNSDQTSQKEMNISNQIQNIKYHKTSGELGALLLEATLIKKMQPIYNRKLRSCFKMTVLKKKTNENGYSCILMETIDEILPNELEHIMGIFKTPKSAKEFLRELAKEYSLCDQLVGLEKGKGSCFSHKLGICKGACEKKELPIKYNVRFLEAFMKTQIKKWPFDGPIIIKEEGENGETGYIIDKWCYVGKVESEYEKEIEQELTFDYDTYKILNRYIHDSKNIKHIQTNVKKNEQNEEYTFAFV